MLSETFSLWFVQGIFTAGLSSKNTGKDMNFSSRYRKDSPQHRQETPAGASSVGARPTPTGTVPELRAEAKRRGIKGYSKLRKKELIAVLAG